MSLEFYTVWQCPWLAPAALALDLLLGDPRLPWPHPVRFIGRLLDILERPARKIMAASASAAAEKTAGRLCGACALALACCLTGSAAFICQNIPWLGPLLALYLAWSGLAMGCLLKTGAEVLGRVENESLEKARAATSWLVSRDTSVMDRPLLRKTLADTLSENYTDAFLAPFFWLCLGGPAALWLYKAVSTMDSQWGYLTPEWRNLGRAGARCDDFLAFIPARISIWALRAGAALMRLSGGRLAGAWPGAKRLASQAKGMPSPNSGWPMAACAWLCGARMAGPSIYFGEMVNKPWLGPPEELAAAWNEKSLLTLMRLLFLAAIAGGALLWSSLEIMGLLAKALF